MSCLTRPTDSLSWGSLSSCGRFCTNSRSHGKEHLSCSFSLSLTFPSLPPFPPSFPSPSSSSPLRQTLLFSATLPKLLVDFAKAGLQDPVLVRLDVESKLSDQLKMSFLAVRSEVKSAVLLHLLKNVISSDQQTVVFAATKHHVEYLKEVYSATPSN